MIRKILALTLLISFNCQALQPSNEALVFSISALHTLMVNITFCGAEDKEFEHASSVKHAYIKAQLQHLEKFYRSQYGEGKFLAIEKNSIMSAGIKGFKKRTEGLYTHQYCSALLNTGSKQLVPEKVRNLLNSIQSNSIQS